MIWPLLSIIFFCAGLIALRQTKKRYPQTNRIYPIFMLGYLATIGLLTLFGHRFDPAHFKLFFLTYPFVLGGAIGVLLATSQEKATAGEEHEARKNETDPGAHGE